MRISDWSSDVCSSDLLGIRERIQPDVDHCALPDDLHPVEDRPRIVKIRIVRRQHLGYLAASELFQQRQQRCHDLVEVGLVVPAPATQPTQSRLVVTHLPPVLLPRNPALPAPYQMSGAVPYIGRAAGWQRECK